MSQPRRALTDLLKRLGLSGTWADQVTIEGADPVVPGRYRPGLASSVALAAQAAAISEIWHQRSGVTQSVTINLKKAAVPGLRTLAYLRRDGHPLQLLRPASEGKVFFTTKDGRQMYLLRHAFYHEHFSRLLECLDCSSATGSIARAVAKWDAIALEDRLAEAKAIGALARTQDEWMAHPQGRHLAPRVPVEITPLGTSRPEPFTAALRPLEGVKIVDMGHVLAGPVVARTLAEQGADVLGVTPPHIPDPNHVIVDTGFGKRTAFIDLRNPDDIRQLHAVIAQADVFIHSWRPGTLDRYGLSPEALAQIRPGLIYCAVSCYGSSGPWSSRAGYDPLGQVVSGLAVGEGSVDDPVLASTFTLNDYLAGYLAAAGVAAALARRAREGGGYHIDVSLTGCSMWLQSLGQLPAHQWSDQPDGVNVLPAVAQGDLATVSSPFGSIEHARPIAEYSETPAYWARPPAPSGAFGLRWD